MRLTVACVQMPHGDTLEANLERAGALAEAAVSRGAEIVLLPEYFFAGSDGPPSGPRVASEVPRFLAETSKRLEAALAGNAIVPGPAGLQNVLYAYDRGALAGVQEKIHPMPREVEWGLKGASDLRVFDLRGAPTGALVCADVFYPEASRVLSLRGARLLLNPVMSPYREDDPTRAAREAVYVARAWDSGAFVLKAGGYRGEGTRRVAGRSLITAPWGTLARYRGDFEEEVLLAELDFEALARFRDTHRGFQARVPEAYRTLLD